MKTLRFNGPVRLPWRYRAVEWEATDGGYIVRGYMKSAPDAIVDAAERFFRVWVWPYLTGGKR
jgi:hypothetical protein